MRKYKDFKQLAEIKDFLPLNNSNDVSDVVSADQMLLAEVFAPDPITRLPQSDIQAFLGSNTNPQVRQFIQEQLMYNTGNSVSDTHLSDDDLKTFSRQANESRSSYLTRIGNFLRDFDQSRKESKSE